MTVKYSGTESFKKIKTLGSYTIEPPNVSIKLQTSKPYSVLRKTNSITSFERISLNYFIPCPLFVQYQVQCKKNLYVILILQLL